MNDPKSLAPIMPNIRLGIRGLPHITNSMISGGLYVLIAETSSARFPLLASNLDSALKENISCTVIVAGNPEGFIQRMESFGQIHGAELIAADQLQIFVMQEEFSKKMFRYGAEGFVGELDNFDIPDNSYLIFDQADELISLHDVATAMDQIDVLGKWLSLHKITATLVFSRVTEIYDSTLNALMDNFTGIARLGGDQNGLRLVFDYWQSPEGTVAARNYQLITLESELYEATIKTTSQDVISAEISEGQEAGTPDPEPHFFYMDPDLGSMAKQMPGVWQRVDTLVGMMHATRSHRLATIILCYQHDTNLRQMAEAAHTLRMSLGRHAKIIAQEKGASLRYQNEALLLRIGVNLVVHRDVPSSRLPLLLESLKGQSFSRDIDVNFEAALASVMPTRLRGYLTPARFAREAEVLLDRAATLSIPYALIVGKPAGNAPMADMLALIKLSRPGDLITADAKYCYLFLNACQQTVMLATMERLVGKSVDTAFDEIRFLVQREEVDPELAALKRAAENGTAPDYSSMVATQPEVVAPVASATPQPTTPAPLLTPASRAKQPVGGPIIPFLGASLGKAPVVATPAAVAAGAPIARSVPPTSVKPPPQDTQITFSPPSLNKKPDESVFGKTQAPRATRSAS